MSSQHSRRNHFRTHSTLRNRFKTPLSRGRGAGGEGTFVCFARIRPTTPPPQAACGHRLSRERVSKQPLSSQSSTLSPPRLLFLAAVCLFVLGGVLLCNGQPSHAQNPSGVLQGHDAPVYKVCFTPNGKWVVTAGFDNTLRLWNAETGQSVRTMEGHSRIVLAAAVSPDGTLIASGSDDRTIKLWDVPVNEPTGSFAAHTGAVNGVAFSEDGTLYVTGGADKLVKLWNAEDGKLLGEFSGQEAAVTHVDIRRDGKQVVGGNTRGVIRVYNTENPEDDEQFGKQQAMLGAHDGDVTGLVLTPNNQFILSAGADGLVKRWPTNLQPARNITGHGGAIRTMALAPNGSRIATGSDDKTVRLWNYNDGKPFKTLSSHGGPVTAVAFTNNSAQLATGSTDKIPRLFDANSGKLIRDFPKQAKAVTAVAVHPNNQFLAAADAAGTVNVYKTAEDKDKDAKDAEQKPEYTLSEHSGAVTAVHYVPNGSQIVTAGADKALRVWNSADGKPVKKVALPAAATAMSLSPNGAQAVVGLADDPPSVQIVNLSDGKPVATFAGHAAPVTSVGFRRDAKAVVSCSDDGTVRVWDVESGLLQQQFLHHAGKVTGAAFANDNKSVVSAGEDKTVWIDRVQVEFVSRASEKAVNDLAVSANSSIYATTDDDGVVKTWSVGNGSQAREFEGMDGPALSVALSPNNQWIAAGGKNKQLLLWNAGNGQLLFRNPTPAEVVELTFSDDSEKLIAAGSDNVIRNYDPTPVNPQPAEPPQREAAQLMSGHTAAIAALAFAPENRTALSASKDGTVKTWSVAAAGYSANMTGHGSQVLALDFSPDGRYLASGSADKTVRLWDVKEKKQIRTLSSQDEPVYSVAFSPDGKLLATAGGDKTVRLINVENGVEIRRFEGPEFAMYSVDFSPNGQMIAAGGLGLGENRKVFLWNVKQTEPARIITGHKDDIYRVQFNAKGNRLLTIGYAGSVNVWDAGSGKNLFSTNMSQVLYSGTYAPQGDRIAVAASDDKAYFIDLPPAAR